MKKPILLFIFNLLVGLNVQPLAQAQITQVADICPGSCSSGLAFPTLFNGKVYFHANSTGTGVELWEYDGTNAPSLVLDIIPGAGSSVPGNFIVYNSKLYFTVNNSSELWAYDGTNTPAIVHDFNVDYISVNLFQNKLYIIAGTSIWSYEGTGSPASLGDFGILGITPYSILGSTSSNLYFTASSASRGTEVWLYAGSGMPTVMDINPGAASSIGAVAYIVNGSNFYFVANDGTHGSELWVHNGTDAPTMVYDINTGSGNGATGMGGMALLNGSVYFQGNSTGTGNEMYAYDGTNNPMMVSDINPGTSGSSPIWFTTVGSEIFFNAQDATHGAELWKYDGSNVSLVQDVASGSLDFYPQHIFGFNSKVYMRGDGDGNDSEFWVYDPLATGVDLAEADHDFRIYPNPLRTAEMPMIKSTETLTHVRVTNVVGEEIYQGTTLQVLNKAGVYFVELEHNGKRSIQRVIVQ